MRARRPPVTPRAARPVAVLLPGLGLSGDYLLPLARALAPVMPSYVIDLPGSGGCPGPAGRLHARHLGDVVARWLAANRLEDVVLIGNSFGSEVALEAGARAPGRVVALALGAPTPDPRARNLGVQLARLVRAAGPAPWWVVRIALRDYARTGVRRLLREARTALREPVVRRLAAASVPVLVIRGERDPVVPGAWAREAAQVARGDLAVIPGAGHAALASHPGAVADAIAAFVSRPPDGRWAGARRAQLGRGVGVPAGRRTRHVVFQPPALAESRPVATDLPPRWGRKPRVCVKTDRVRKTS